MSDDQNLDGLSEEYDPDLEAEEDEERKGRNSRGIIAVIIAIIIVIIVLLLLRDCGGGDSAGVSNDKKTIESVAGMTPTDGLVSIWIADTTTLDQAMSAAGVGGSDQIDLGGGRYVVSVPKGSEASAVKKLCDAPGVYDAGLVYERKEK